MRRALPVTAAGLSLLLLIGSAPVPAAAVPPARPVLLADGDFGSILRKARSAWTCEPEARLLAVSLPPGADFLHLIPVNDPEVPPAAGRPPTPTPPTTTPVPPPLAAARAAVQDVPAGSTPPAVEAWQNGILAGTPGPAARAVCRQTVPIRGGTAYTLSARVRGGMAFLGTEYGSVWAPASAAWTPLSTTFTTDPGDRFVTVFLHGWYGGQRYEADDVSLVGPTSTTDVPAAPADLSVDRHTSAGLWLTWSGVPGAGTYLVLRDGVPAVASAGTSALVTGLTPGRRYTLTVVARNDAGQSVPSGELVVDPVPVYSSPPNPPAIRALRLTGSPRGPVIALSIEPGSRTTDGFVVFVNGQLMGWTFDQDTLVGVTGGGEFTVEVAGLNSAGQSARGPAAKIVLPGT